MRLIDADELMEHAWRDKLDSRELIAKMIEQAPTVKEIPTKIPIDIFERLVSQEPCDVPDINDGNIYECSCGYGWDKSKVVRHHFCPNCGKAVDSSYNSIKTKLKPYEDCISRQDAIKKVSKILKGVFVEYEDIAQKAIGSLPSVAPHQKMGHWEWVQYDSNPNIGNWHCSECRCVVIECGDKKSKGDIPLYKYCPQCGCRIVEPQESEVSE